MITEIKLDISHQIRKRINVSRFEIYKHEDAILNRMVYDFTACFAGTHQDPHIFRTPATWWEHFKLRFFRGWLLRKWPVKYAETKIDVKLLYPKLKSELPRDMMGPYVTVMTSTPDSTRFQNFDPDTPVSPMELCRKVAEKMPLGNGEKCPVCSKPFRYDE